jgi:hypothetical protein
LRTNNEIVAERVVNIVKYIPVAVATLGSRPVIIKAGPNIMPAGGTCLGIFFQRWIVEKFKRVSFTNMFLVFGMLVNLLSTIAITILVAVHKADLGDDIF